MPLFASPKPFLDATRGDPEAAALRQAATASDWQSVETALARANDLGRREFLIEALAARTTNLGWVDAWVRARPAEQTPRAVWGACAVQYAFQIRTGAVPEKVPAERMQAFHEWLGHAETQLVHATEMDTADSAPWVARIWAAVGRGASGEGGDELWQGAAKRNPQTDLGAIANTTFISPRWQGSAERMWRFVHGLVGNESEGSPRWTLVPMAHFEQWVAERMQGNARVHSSQYFLQPQVQAEIRDAYARYLGSPARQSSPLQPQHRETFACAFYLMGARDELRRELDQVGPGIQQVPWAYIAAPLVAYQSVREAAGLK